MPDVTGTVLDVTFVLHQLLLFVFYLLKMPESSLEYGFVFRNISVCIIIYGGKLYRMLWQNS